MENDSVIYLNDAVIYINDGVIYQPRTFSHK